MTTIRQNLALTVALTSSPELLKSSDPWELGDKSAGYLAWYLYDPLVYLSEQDQLMSGLAEEVEVSLNNSTYNFKLRRDVRFHDGTHFDANSVVSSWKRGNDIGEDGWKSMRAVEVVDPTDPYRVRITLAAGADGFLAETVPFLPIVKQVVGVGYEQQLIGTGQFKLDQQDGQIALVANPDYWGPKDMPIEQLILRKFAESEQALATKENCFVFSPTMEEFLTAPVLHLGWNDAQSSAIVELYRGCPSCAGEWPGEDEPGSVKPPHRKSKLKNLGNTKL